jgi:hypothetical protein
MKLEKGQSAVVIVAEYAKECWYLHTSSGSKTTCTLYIFWTSWRFSTGLASMLAQSSSAHGVRRCFELYISADSLGREWRHCNCSKIGCWGQRCNVPMVISHSCVFILAEDLKHLVDSSMYCELKKKISRYLQAVRRYSACNALFLPETWIAKRNCNPYNSAVPSLKIFGITSNCAETYRLHNWWIMWI